MPHDITDISLHKAARDAGFEILEQAAEPSSWSQHRSCRFSLVVWAQVQEEGAVLALSKQDVLEKLQREHPQAAAHRGALPPAAIGAVVADNSDILYAMLIRIGQLELSLPHRIAEAFMQETQKLPRETEAERLVVQRVGQGKLREGLLEYWQSKCMVTNLHLPDVLRASHIKPWSKCETDQDRLNIYNALLLAPHLDALFDRGLITFTDSGAIQFSPVLDTTHREQLSLHNTMAICRVEPQHLPFLQYHREFVFRG